MSRFRNSVHLYIIIIIIYSAPIRHVFYQSAFESINKLDSKLRTYSLIKESVEIENYLITTRNINARVCLTKFGLSNHKLMFETGRHQKVPKTERFCPFCYGMIEDEIHLLINCKQLRRPKRSPIQGMPGGKEKLLILF